ncbi:MAG: hypothetical protein PVF58_05490 [Candidatus Methanofastidiosia archaeon]|jgi:hypothetical protein
MKYVWLVIVLIGVGGVYIGLQDSQVQYTAAFGEYPCFLCFSVKPHYEIVIFLSADYPHYEYVVSTVQKFCRVTQVEYGGAYYDDSHETPVKLQELGLQKTTDVLVVVVQDGVVVDQITRATELDSALSQSVKEVSRL